LADISDILPKAQVVYIREVTKKFEEVKRGAALELLEHFKMRKPRGEFVVVINQK